MRRLVGFATEPGKTASHIGKGSGPYAAAPMAELVTPAQKDLLMLHNVRVAIRIHGTETWVQSWTSERCHRGSLRVAPAPHDSLRRSHSYGVAVRADRLGRSPLRRFLNAAANSARGPSLWDGLRTGSRDYHRSSFSRLTWTGKIDAVGDQACVAGHEFPASRGRRHPIAARGHRAKARRADQRNADVR